MAKTHYEVLGVGKDASAKEIRAAYRKLVLIHHPDRSKAPNATALFVRISEAYEVLSDPARRASYDRLIAPKPAAARPASPSPKVTPKAPPRKPSPTLAADLVRLTSLLGKARYVEAERLAQRLTRQHPGEAIPYAVLADIHRFRGELKQAAEMYSYAVQMAPGNEVYQEKHEQVLAAMSHRERSAGAASSRNPVPPVLIGSGVALVAAIYVALHNERPTLPDLAIVSTWTLGLVVMLFLSGVAAGATLALSGLLDSFGETHGSAVAKVPPSAILGMVALANYWAAAALYVLVGSSQNAFNATTSHVVAAVGAITCLMTVSSAANGLIDPTQTFWWGGNVIYLGALVGWLVADSFRS